MSSDDVTVEMVTFTHPFVLPGL
ncbi:MAG: hypothetical protein JWQ89_2640, partial [Devosia sp.]|nr:hypothetical protein [Devosia sp.]